MTVLTKNFDKKIWLHAALLVAAILVAYGKVFHAGFISWDDLDYVFHTKDISSGIGAEQIKKWFSKNYIGNYQPLPVFTYALDYMIGGTDPFIYHLQSILWHIADALLIYYFFNKLQGNKWVSFFVALLFAVHPVQTESVSWIAARNKGMNAFFFFAALCFYIDYVRTQKKSKLVWVTILGLLAYLCKATALSLPLALFAVDIWLQRPLKVKTIWLEKLPLVLIGIPVAMATLAAQKDVNFLEHHTEFSWHSIVFAGYALVQYVVHLILPVNLSVLYPYPKSVTILHVFYLFIAVALVMLTVLAYKKKQYVWAGGLLFFIVNMLPVLQFVQFGETIMADRYLYIGCVGIFYPIVYYLFKWFDDQSKTIVAITICSAVSAIFFIQTFVRNDIWLSETNFWNSVLEKFPESSVAQYSIGAAYMKEGRLSEAERHIDLAVQYDPNNYKAWHNKGSLHLRQGKAMESLDALNRSLEIVPYHKAYFTRAMLYQGTGKPEMAIADISKVLEAQPENARAYYIKADCEEQLNRIAEAQEDYNKAIELEPREPLFYIRRGLLLAKLNKKTEALGDLEHAVSLKPDNGEALFYRGLIKYSLGQNACADWQAALQYGYRQASEMLAKACR
jgi:Tfp pilus assembly protein PilF